MSKIIRTLFREEKSLRQVLAAFFAFLFILSLSASVFAYTGIDTGKDTSLTLRYTTEAGAGIEGVAFKLYKVADVSDVVIFTVTSDFAAAGIDMNEIPKIGEGDSGYWTSLASSLEAYVSENGISAAAKGTTSPDGFLSFENLSVGLYLLVGENAVVGDCVYTPSAAMILLPTFEEDTDEWNYNPASIVKYTCTDQPGGSVTPTPSATPAPADSPDTPSGPTTGDNSNSIFWVYVLIAAVAVIGICIIRRL